jgi:2-beta-glucuronyltransferase
MTMIKEHGTLSARSPALVEAGSGAERTVAARLPAATGPDWLHGPFLIITRHDYRTALQVNLHHCAAELTRHGHVFFFSVGFSWLSRLTDDPRLALWPCSNRIETIDGVDCYLWRRAYHPFNLRLPALAAVEASLFASYASNLPREFIEAVAKARLIIIESGIGIVFFEAVKRINPSARVIYFASDDVKAINCSSAIEVELARTIDRYDAVVSPSRRLARQLAMKIPGHFLPYGMDPARLTGIEENPFAGGTNAVTAGASLFDPQFFKIAAPAFPDVTFHLIGCGARADGIDLPNVRIYPQMPGHDVLRHFKHAHFGIAPYAAHLVDPYHLESSQKLNHFGLLGVPAVCPQIAAGDVAGRFGYRPDAAASIAAAIRAALAHGHFPGRPVMQWPDIVARLLRPDDFDDTRI